MKLGTNVKVTETRRRLCNDVRRELRWGYRDQSIRNMNELVKKIADFADKNNCPKARLASNALASYTFTLSQFKKEGFIPANIRLKSCWLLNIMRDWELSQETSARK